jgi:anti-sigma factor RsiW
MSEHPDHEIVAYLRGELPAADGARIAVHLEGCARCRTAAADTDQVLSTLRAAPPPVDWGGYRAGVRARVAARTARRSAARTWRPIPIALAAGLAAGALVAGLQLAPERGNGELAMLEPIIADRLPLLEEYRIVERLDLLEDLDVIRQLDLLPPDAS